MKKHKVILDVDNATGIPVCDVDDGMTIALALASPELDVLGITTCAGNCRTHESTHSTLRMLELAGRSDIPVATGRELPFIQDVTASFEYLDQRRAQHAYYWQDVPPLPDVTLQPSPLKAHEFIIEMVKQHPGEVTILKAGSHTNLALALLVEPEIAPLVKAVVHMGGDTGTPWWADNADDSINNPEIWRDIVRMNQVYDPEATEIVVRSGIPFTWVTAKVSARVLLRMAHVDRIQAVDTPYHQFLANVARPWVQWEIDVCERQGAPMWDPLTLATIIDPTFCTFVTMRCDLDRFRNWEFPYLYPSPDTPQVQVSMDVDIARFEEFLIERLTSNDGTQYANT
ncbi:MAG: nucleoside hydrolase [Chloroflexota bacterium]